ncbi:hypothetical protein [Pseudonocardia sp. DLS-67]
MTHDELVAFCLAKPGAAEDESRKGDVVAKLPKRLRPWGAWIAARGGPGSDLIATIVTWTADVRFMSRIR